MWLSETNHLILSVLSSRLKVSIKSWSITILQSFGNLQVIYFFTKRIKDFLIGNYQGSIILNSIAHNVTLHLVFNLSSLVKVFANFLPQQQVSYFLKAWLTLH